MPMARLPLGETRGGGPIRALGVSTAGGSRLLGVGSRGEGWGLPSRCFPGACLLVTPGVEESLQCPPVPLVSQPCSSTGAGGGAVYHKGLDPFFLVQYACSLGDSG